MRLEVIRDTPASRAAVWQVLTAWERQAEWMVDALEVEVLTPRRDGIGVTLRCPTRLVGVVVQDVLRVTGWEPLSYLEVAHLGRVIRGTAAFELSEVAGGTRIRWWEEVDVPLGRVGEWGATAVLPLLRRVFSRSLANLAALAERQHDTPA